MAWFVNPWFDSYQDNRQGRPHMKAADAMIPVFDLQTHHSKVEVPHDFDLRDLSRKYAVFPLKVITMNGRRRLLLAMKNPFDGKAVLDIEFRAGMDVVPVQADNKDIQWLIQTHYFGKKMSPLPSRTDEVTHDVFAQFEIVSKVHERPEYFSESLKPFSKEEK
jgi:hypothetical protein